MNVYYESCIRRTKYAFTVQNDFRLGLCGIEEYMMSNKKDITIHHQLDTKGLRCPEPIMLLHRIMRKAQSGEVIEILATDPSTSWDIARFCTHLNHQLLLQEEISAEPTEYRYLIQKG